MKLTSKNIQILRQLETSDYQNRKGNYPRSDVPDNIDVFVDNKNLILNAMFKNTSEKIAEKWMRQYLMAKVGDVSTKANYSTYQSGDYADDWVTVSITFKV